MPIARRLAATGMACMALLTAACAGDDDGAEPAAISSCSRLVYEGEGEPDVVVVSNMPRRGGDAQCPEPQAIAHVVPPGSIHPYPSTRLRRSVIPRL